jgi:hypothetical protein
MEQLFSKKFLQLKELMLQAFSNNYLINWLEMREVKIPIQVPKVYSLLRTIKRLEVFNYRKKIMVINKRNQGVVEKKIYLFLRKKIKTKISNNNLLKTNI